jgi:hypothetical protein
MLRFAMIKFIFTPKQTINIIFIVLNVTLENEGQNLVTVLRTLKQNL